MINAIKKLFGAGKRPGREAVAAGLLLEVIRMDKDFDADEQQALSRIIETRFAASSAEARALIGTAQAAPPATYDDSALLASINETHSPAEKADLVAMLWEIALADGELHRFENHAVLAIANQLGMGQAEIDAAKAAARTQLAASR